jgi:hypothetical protein
LRIFHFCTSAIPCSRRPADRAALDHRIKDAIHDLVGGFVKLGMLAMLSWVADGRAHLGDQQIRPREHRRQRLKGRGLLRVETAQVGGELFVGHPTQAVALGGDQLEDIEAGDKRSLQRPLKPWGLAGAGIDRRATSGMSPLASHPVGRGYRWC